MVIGDLHFEPLLGLLRTADWLNEPTYWLVGVVIVALIVASIIGQTLKRQPENTVSPALLRTFNQRVRAWWMMFAILAAGLLLGYTCTIVLFGFVSFWALREFITMTPTRRGDHRTLFWVFFIFTPIQYVLVGVGNSLVEPKTPSAVWWADTFGLRGVDLYGLYSIMIPVYASLYIPARIALSGDARRFLERSAKIQFSLLICVYSLSFAPAIAHLNLLTSKPAVSNSSMSTGDVTPIQKVTNEEPSVAATEETEAQSTRTRRRWEEGGRAGLLFYFILIVQLSDVFQYAWGKLLGQRVIAPHINASRTWEGFVGGALTTAIVGALLWWVTPFRIWEAACMAFVTAVMGSAGGMTMSAIKRDRGVTDTGTLVQGHAGVLDRIDSICFAAPVFFHLTRYFFSDLT
ncbi:MAG: phosphatidate cytidylyltransferase [Planctomycetaceae bacterium]|nr:phosphatidate cytidylyltransferase [Planctomycetales bacterium]MCB9921330.1 phosphatidate cytidylyltransferase [Planctomycetaceae bacterium]